ncbi:MAG TPA: lipoprotein [Gammaproteobacteria bacterium]
MPKTRLFAPLLSLLLCGLLLAGCGQKGRLYLPDDAPPTRQAG